ncbi:hypothetical protein DSCO28_01830 [Desulfosarcina ovata subsp. sediminis]|uniref:Uncharacterized protein n=1 Tax=Desulfosarcina ovata subsp. sediminis TaxID=885957 RepID=A0A5K7ZI42_9BACT|nr:hypothetical protein [Desulfosarcina ovata]BBO79617.1 hypothetical protein DSCO28_01830 [Desulfosarcina ovata subsp. sediminis]
MIHFAPGTICKQNLDSKTESEETVTDKRWSIDFLPILMPLWHKHNVKAHNFNFRTNEDSIVYIEFDLAGDSSSIRSFYNDLLGNMKYFQKGLVELFDNAPPERDITGEFEERERKKEIERNPPPRPKYDAKMHKFMI